jgi:gluconate 5-dehydrogenase
MAHALFDLSGKTALVTGAARGLGLAMARALGGAGAALALTDLDAGGLGEAVSRLAADGLRVVGRPLDVREAGQIVEVLPALARDAGPIHILVNNAAVQRRAPVAELDDSAWRDVLNTNLTAASLVARSVVPGMIARRAGKIINLCSIMAIRGRPTISAYMASKGGLHALTRAMAVEWGRFNVQANAIGPGYMRTELNRSLLEEPSFVRWAEERTPAGRWGSPGDLSGVAVYLAAPASDFVTGQLICVDGGMLAAL